MVESIMKDHTQTLVYPLSALSDLCNLSYLAASCGSFNDWVEHSGLVLADELLRYISSEFYHRSSSSGKDVIPLEPHPCLRWMELPITYVHLDVHNSNHKAATSSSSCRQTQEDPNMDKQLDTDQFELDRFFFFFFFESLD